MPVNLSQTEMCLTVLAHDLLSGDIGRWTDEQRKDAAGKLLDLVERMPPELFAPFMMKETDDGLFRVRIEVSTTPRDTMVSTDTPLRLVKLLTETADVILAGAQCSTKA